MTTNLKEKAATYRLPEITTPEELEMAFYNRSATFLNFGDKVLMAGHYYNGPRQNSYYAAIYEYADSNRRTCEDEIRLTAISDGFFSDNGHAIAWALAQ